ncbi:protein kinase domain-containing protein [Streptomyces sp. T028]|uniref:protein kinase domain-containing protein n=1 Tax=Streptomyces sp. T028 TaxID=3394379 RepID=UPI003A8BA824
MNWQASGGFRSGTAQQPADPMWKPPTGYAQLSRLAVGRHSTVFQGREQATGAVVAVKILHAVVHDESRRLSAHSELLSAAVAAKHPCSVPVTEAGFTPDHRPFLVQAFLRGGTAQARLAASGPLSAADAVVVGIRLSLALHASHHRGVLHLDVRPANILYDDVGDAFLADHGISRILQRCDPGTGAVFDPAYAPRELLGWENPGPATDVYGLGATLYALLSGGPPRSEAARTSPSALYTEVLGGEPPPPRTPGVPDQLLALVRRMMSRDPEGRPPLTEVHRVLRLLLPASHTARVPELEPEPAPRPPLPGWDPAEDVAAEEAAEETGVHARDRSRRRLIGTGVVTAVFAATAVTVTLVLSDGDASDGPGSKPSPTGAQTAQQVPAAELPALMPRNVTAIRVEDSVQVTWQAPEKTTGVVGYVVDARAPDNGKPVRKTTSTAEPTVVFSAGSVPDGTCYTVTTLILTDGQSRFAPAEPLCRTEAP